MFLHLRYLIHFNHRNTGIARPFRSSIYNWITGVSWYPYSTFINHLKKRLDQHINLLRFRNNFFHNSPFNFISTWLSSNFFYSNFNIFPLLCIFLCQSTYQFNKYIASNYVCHCVILLINSIYFLFNCMLYNCFGVNLLINSITMYEYFLYNVCIGVDLHHIAFTILFAL